jgi:hypothetical protein
MFEIGDVVLYNCHHYGFIVAIQDNILGKNRPKVYTIEFFDGGIKCTLSKNLLLIKDKNEVPR